MRLGESSQRVPLPSAAVSTLWECLETADDCGLCYRVGGSHGSLGWDGFRVKWKPTGRKKRTEETLESLMWGGEHHCFSDTQDTFDSTSSK